jgi:hypothetical protein
VRQRSASSISNLEEIHNAKETHRTGSRQPGLGRCFCPDQRHNVRYRRCRLCLELRATHSFPGTNKFSGIQSGLLSGSRLGFKGEEALGNGLKAIFTLEYSLNIDNNSGIGSTGGLNARQQFVGLAGGFGTVALGRQYSPGYQATANNDPAGGAAF